MRHKPLRIESGGHGKDWTLERCDTLPLVSESSTPWVMVLRTRRLLYFYASRETETTRPRNHMNIDLFLFSTKIKSIISIFLSHSNWWLCTGEKINHNYSSFPLCIFGNSIISWLLCLSQVSFWHWFFFFFFFVSTNFLAPFKSIVRIAIDLFSSLFFGFEFFWKIRSAVSSNIRVMFGIT